VKEVGKDSRGSRVSRVSRRGNDKNGSVQSKGSREGIGGNIIADAISNVIDGDGALTGKKSNRQTFGRDRNKPRDSVMIVNDAFKNQLAERGIANPGNKFGEDFDPHNGAPDHPER